MEESEDNIAAEDLKKVGSMSAVKKPKKRSLVERELETSLTSRVTSPAIIPDALSTSRYGRARRLKTETDLVESQKIILAAAKSPGNETSPIKVQSPVYRMHASNSPQKAETPKKTSETLDNQIDNIYQENISLSRFSEENVNLSPNKKLSKVYIRKDLIQNREEEEDEPVMLIKNLFSPMNSSMKSSSRSLRKSLDRSVEKFNSKQNGYVDNASVVKTLNFDVKKNRKSKEQKRVLSKNELFELEAKCPYQVGDLAWARMGTFPFWPCMVTREPYSEMFVKKKLFGRVEHDIIHVTFFGDNGRRSWIVDNMLRNYLGPLEFKATREKFTPEDKKKDPRLYAAFFISEKKQALWNTSVEEAETVLREPKRLRVDIFNEMLLKLRASKKTQKSGKITRTDSDVSLSESLYDSLFSEDDVKTDDADRSKNRTRNKSFDVSEVVTACLDNMAAKTGITKIQRQSHMDRWLQKAKSKTPEKNQGKGQALTPSKVEKAEKTPSKPTVPVKVEKLQSSKIKKKTPTSEAPKQKPYRFRHSKESQSKLTKVSVDESVNGSNDATDESAHSKFGLGVITKVESLASNVENPSNDKNESIITIEDDSSDVVAKTKNDLEVESTLKPIETDIEIVDNLKKVDEDKNTIAQTDELPKRNLEIICKINVLDQDNVMDIDNNIETPDKTVKTNDLKCDSLEGNETMEVDDDTKVQSQMTEEKPSVKYKTVSSTSVEDSKIQLNNDNCNIKCDTDLKEAQNVVTIEASVTETKNDDTINNQAEEHKDSNDIPKHFKNSENDVAKIDILEGNINQDCKVGPHETLERKNTVTETKEDINTAKTPIDISTEKSDLNHVLNSDKSESFRDLDKKLVLSDDSKINNSKNNLYEKNIAIDENISEKTTESQNEIDAANLSGNSESILYLSDEIDSSKNEKSQSKCKSGFNILLTQSSESETTLDISQENDSQSANSVQSSDADCSKNEECHSKSVSAMDISITESDISESILDISQTNETAEIDVEMEEYRNKAERDCFSEENHNSSINTPLIGINNKSESILENGKENQSTLGNDAELEIFKTSHKSSSVLDENDESSNREYVESPTFTQLLESEEFFRDVNETCENINNQNQISKNVTSQLLNSHNNENDTQTTDNIRFNHGNLTNKTKITDQLSLTENILHSANDTKQHIINNIGNKKYKEVTEKPQSIGNKSDNYECKTDLQNHKNKICDKYSDKIFESTNKSDKTISLQNHSCITDEFNELKPICNIEKESLNTDNIEEDNLFLFTNDSKNIANFPSEIQNIDGDCDVEESDDEPSPEYESLDEDITEDFRKHMMSIEKNITDKKDEEQIVKICIEIAEKAKLSPTKYNSDFVKPQEKHDISPKDKVKKSIDILNKPKSPEKVDVKNKEIRSADSEYMNNSEFINYMELRQDILMDENPQLTHTEIANYLYKTWLYEEKSVCDAKKNDEFEQDNLVKEVNDDGTPMKKEIRVNKTKSENKAKKKSDFVEVNTKNVLKNVIGHEKGDITENKSYKKAAVKDISVDVPESKLKRRSKTYDTNIDSEVNEKKAEADIKHRKEVLHLNSEVNKDETSNDRQYKVNTRRSQECDFKEKNDDQLVEVSKTQSKDLDLKMKSESKKAKSEVLKKQSDFDTSEVNMKYDKKPDSMLAYFAKQKKTKTEAEFNTWSTKENDLTINSQDKTEDIVIKTKQVKNIELKLNGDATIKEIAENSKKIYRTRLSTSSLTKERASPDIKVQSSKIEQLRNSCEYDPKVVIIPLERDKTGLFKETFSKATSSEDIISTRRHNNTRLSLKRDSHTIQPNDGKIADTDPEIKLETETLIKFRSIEDKKPKCKQSNARLSLKRGGHKAQHKESELIDASLEIRLGELEPINKGTSFEDKSPESRLSHTRLSLKRDSNKRQHNEKKITNTDPEIKVEDTGSLESELTVKGEDTITLNKAPKKIHIENGAVETNIPEPVLVNGYNHVNRKYTDTPELLDDTDFDVDAVSLNSEDSDISYNSVESAPKRNLRSRPERTLENALSNPEFLNYLELKQDYLMDEHPELNEDEVVLYIYKTWQYEEDLKSNYKKIEDAHHSGLVKGLKQNTPSRKHSKKSQPKTNIENMFREKFERCRNTIDFDSESGNGTLEPFDVKQDVVPEPPIESSLLDSSEIKSEDDTADQKTLLPELIDLTSESNNEVELVKDPKEIETLSIKSEVCATPKRTLRSKAITPKSLQKQINQVKHEEDKPIPDANVKEERDFDTESVDSEDSEVPLRQLRSKVFKENRTNKSDYTTDKNVETINKSKEPIVDTNIKEEIDETASTISDNEPLLKQKKRKADSRSLDDPEFIKYLGLRQDTLMDEHPELTQNEIVSYLYKTWLYEEKTKSELEKNEELEQASLVKGLNNDVVPPKKIRRRPKAEKQSEDIEVALREKPRRRIAQPFYNENLSDIEDELEVFEIFKTEKDTITVVSKTESEKDKAKSPSSKGKESTSKQTLSPKLKLKSESVDAMEEVKVAESLAEETEQIKEVKYVDAIEMYFAQLTKPKPNVFKGLIREKVCEICSTTGNLVKCKGCLAMFHPECVKRETEVIDVDAIPNKGRKKKRKPKSRKTKSIDSESHSDDKSQDVSAESIEDIAPLEIGTFDADTVEAQLAAKMKEMLDTAETIYDSYSSDDGLDWKDTVAGKCEIVEVKLKRRDAPIDYSEFKCNNCQVHDVPVCFVCKQAVSKTGVKMRQKCHVAHCHTFYHLECLNHWPQTQFNSGEPSKNNKKISEFFEALTCPKHVCHTCVSDDPRGCKTRFSGDKLARCVRCPATYHSFNRCLPAGSQILTASHIICPRHCDQRPGKAPCHVNTGWCFICAQGGSLICCEYCPTSFHAECLKIKPPEGNYMCEDCETGRLPLYGEMVWVKLGHYRWWPGMILHPSEIPENIMAVRHGPGEFVVRFFGQYDHYWVNRGRVFPYQEGDSGRISGQKSKIDAAFTMAIEHAKKAYAILKAAKPNQEESQEIASSLLPPHYVKLKSNKPCGSLCGKKIEDPSLSLTQCECNPDEPEPCGPYSQCLNRMLLTECGPTCRAGERCNNRAFEKRLYPKLTPYRTPHRGWGLKTLEMIKGGQFVIEYVGELIDEDEFKRRMNRKHEIRDENFYFLTLDKERMIDAGPKGNLARFMNHCCEPNCETQKWTVLGDVRVGLFAIDDIPADSEVTFNYNLECAGIEKKECLCGAKRCSGYIGAKPKQDESQFKKNKEGKIPTKRIYRKKKPEESPSTSKLKPKRLGRPPKPKELTEIEKDLLIIKNATNGISSDESSGSQSVEDKKAPRESVEDKNPKSLKRKRVSISTSEVSLCNELEPSVKRLKCEEKTEVGD